MKNLKSLKKCIFTTIALLSLNISNSFSANHDKSHESKELSNDKKLTYGLFSSFEKANFSFDTPNAHSILKWRDMKNYSIGSEVKYKISDNFLKSYGIKNSEAFFSYTYSNLTGEGTDDDIANYDLNNSAVFSVQKAKGHTHDYRFGMNLDISKYNNLTSSLRIGGFHKKIKFDMTNGYSSFVDFNSGYAEASYFNDGLGQRTNSKFSGFIIGGKISSKSIDTENVLIVDLYPLVSYKGKQFWPQREPEDKNWSLKHQNHGFGYKITTEHYFKVNNQNLKLFSSYESIKIHKLNEYGSLYQTIGGADDSAVAGSARFDSFNIGAGIYF